MDHIEQSSPTLIPSNHPTPGFLNIDIMGQTIVMGTVLFIVRCLAASWPLTSRC